MTQATRAFRRSLVLSALAAGLLGPASARADETLLCQFVVPSVPYTITRPGHYCLRRNIFSSLAGGAAITIEASDVWLDLNNYALDNTAAGPAVEASGIFSSGHRNITVRNGAVRGFMFGVDLGTGANGRNFNVEGLRLESNTLVGIFLFADIGPGGGHVVRNNVVRDTGGSTAFGSFTSWGIVVDGGGHVSDNEILHVFPAAAGMASQAIGIELRSGTAIAGRDRVSRVAVGVNCTLPEKYLHDNVVVASTTAYAATCTKAGTDNYP
jgi:hypothetical protein